MKIHPEQESAQVFTDIIKSPRECIEKPLGKKHANAPIPTHGQGKSVMDNGIHTDKDHFQISSPSFNREIHTTCHHDRQVQHTGKVI